MPKRIGPGGPFLVPTQAGEFPGYPFAQSDWPNPSGTRTDPPQHINARLTGGPYPNRQTDWFTPVRQFVAAAIFGTLAPNLLASTLATTTPTPIVPGGFQNPVRAAIWLAPNAGSNPILYGTPFTPTEFPNPVRATARLNPDVGSNTILYGVPFVPVEWAVPRAVGAQQPVNPPNLRTSVVVAAPPFAQTQWDNPLRREFAQVFNPPNLQTVPTVPVAAPFIPIAFDNPLRREPAQVVNPSNVTPLGAVVVNPPFYQTAWPNPEVGRKAVAPESYNHTDVGTPTPSTDKPFAQYDWVVPKGKGGIEHPPVAFRPDSEEATASPFTPIDWPNPVPREYAQQDWVPNLLPTLRQTVSAKPFAQGDWPNPLRAGQPVHVTVQNTILYDTPFRQADWVVPKGYAQGVTSLTWTQDLATSTLNLPVFTPFQQNDWVNPRGYQRAIDLRTHLNPGYTTEPPPTPVEETRRSKRHPTLKAIRDAKIQLKSIATHTTTNRLAVEVRNTRKVDGPINGAVTIRQIATYTLVADLDVTVSVILEPKGSSTWAKVNSADAMFSMSKVWQKGSKTRTSTGVVRATSSAAIRVEPVFVVATTGRVKAHGTQNPSPMEIVKLIRALRSKKT